MKRRTLLLLAALLGATLASAGRLEAQVRFYFGSPLDTAFGLIPGKIMSIPVRGSYYCAGALSAGRWTIRYDTSKVRIAGLIPGALDSLLDTTASTPGLFSVRGTNVNTMPCGSDQVFFTLEAALNPSASSTFLWTSVDTFTTPSGNVAQAQRSSIAQLCRATQVYGDVNGDSLVNSADALIVLSAAVGLPVTGFNLQAGDVDRDGLTTSRDALFILSYSIGLYVPATLSIGEGDPVACPGTSVPGEAVVFKRNGSGIEFLSASSTTPTLVPGTLPVDSAPRLAADGATIVYQCADSVYPQYYSQICRINTSGAGKVRLFPGWPTAYNQSVLPDINPSGARIAFLSSPYMLFTMADSIGALRLAFQYPDSIQVQVYANVVAWSRDGLHLAYTSTGLLGYTPRTSYPAGLYVVDSAGATVPVRLDTAYTYQPYFGEVRWSPAGDLVAYVREDGRIWAVPAVGGAAVPQTNFVGANGSNGVVGFDWGPQGLIFGLDATGNGTHPSLWLLPSSNSPIQRITVTPSGDWQPSFRRNP